MKNDVDNSNPLVSIIIPIHNSEYYLKKCINSVLKQSYKKLEILLINNNSNDNSEKICDYFLKKDTRIKYFFEPRAGVSYARNCGILNAKGDYCYFLDSDDWLKKNAIDTLIQAASSNNSDIVFGNICLIDNVNKSPPQI